MKKIEKENTNLGGEYYIRLNQLYRMIDVSRNLESERTKKDETRKQCHFCNVCHFSYYKSLKTKRKQGDKKGIKVYSGVTFGVEVCHFSLPNK